MSESLKIIHICDHIVKSDYEELKIASINRQETRNNEIIECVDKRLIYSENWEYVEESNADKYYQASTPGETVTIYFYGDNIRLYSRKSSDGGKVKVSIDGEEFGVIDLYHSSSVKNEPIIDIDKLVYGMHTVEAKLLSTSNASSEGSVLRIESALIKDAFIIEHSPYDVISGADIVKQVNRVYQYINNEVKEFEKDVDYSLIGGNKLRWISVNRPNPAVPYNVEYIRKFSKSETYKTSTCPRCYGLGWYGSFNNLTSGLPSKSVGIYKIAEDIIKILLTPLREDGYGSELVEMNKYLYMEASAVEDTATSEINRIERYYKSVQADEIAKGATYTPEDTLYAIIINNINFNIETSTLSIELTVYNNVGQSHKTNINI